MTSVSLEHLYKELDSKIKVTRSKLDNFTEISDTWERRFSPIPELKLEIGNKKVIFYLLLLTCLEICINEIK